MFNLTMITDMHYTEGLIRGSRHCCDSVNKIKLLDDVFGKSDICVHLGDLINGTGNIETDLKALCVTKKELEKYKFYHVMGNHDSFALPKEEVMKTDKELGAVYTFERENVKFIVLDANFTSEEKSYARGVGTWTDSVIPQKQINWLERELENSNGAIIFCHQNIDERFLSTGELNPHVIKNHREVRKVLEDSGKVRYVFQGHCHIGADSVINGINYHTIKAICENDNIPYCVAKIESFDNVKYEDFNRKYIK